MGQRTRIVCTLGPASSTDEILRGMMRAGMDVARLNFSHGDHALHAAHLARVRECARAEGAVVATLADLQGPKMRVGHIAAGVARLVAGKTLTLTTRSVPGDAECVGVDYADFPRAVQPGHRVLLDDGLIALQVVSVGATDVLARVVIGGELRPRKGINLPGVSLDVPALTAKDRADLAFAIEQDVDYLALSFVRCAADVRALKDLVRQHGAAIPVIAKIEKPEAMAQIDAILAESDGVMVARGDLGVEVSPEQVPIFQKRLIRKANAAGKPVITATQMLESMLHSARPTRAEASDVANAILDGTDAVMLSGETAIGAYPVEAVQMMAHIADAVETSLQAQPCAPAWDRDAMSVTDAIGNATREMARQLNARVIITSTFSGYTARMISRHRPLTPIFAVTSSARTQRQLALVWGVQTALVKRATTLDEIVAEGLQHALQAGIVAPGDLAVITAGVPVGAPGRTNMVQVRVVGEQV